MKASRQCGVACRVLALITLSLLVTSMALADYAEDTRRVIVRVVGKNFKNYHFHAIPLTNVGVGTIYRPSSSKSIENWLLTGHPSSWFADNLTQAQRDSLLNVMIVEGEYGSFTLSEKDSKNINVGLVISSLLSKIGVRLGIEGAKDTRVWLTVNKARHRLLNWTEFRSALRAGCLKPSIKNVIERDTFAIVTRDVVFDDYTLRVETGNNLGLAAELSRVTDTLKGADSLGFCIKKSGEALFTINAAKNVIIAVLLQTPYVEAFGLRKTDSLDMASIENWSVVTGILAPSLDSLVIR